MANAINKAVMVKFRYIEEFIKASLRTIFPHIYQYSTLIYEEQLHIPLGVPQKREGLTTLSYLIRQIYYNICILTLMIRF